MVPGMGRDLFPAVLAQVVLTGVLCGLIWLVQVVLYPGFALVGPDAFPAYHTAEVRRISWLVVPLMSLEGVLAVLTLVRAPREPLAWIAGGLLGAVWLSTALLQVPLHERLSQVGLETATIEALVAGNVLRTAAWTLRLASLVVWLIRLRRHTG